LTEADKRENERHCFVNLGPDSQNILRQSYDSFIIMRKLLWTYDGRLMYKTSYEGRKGLSLLTYYSLAESSHLLRLCS